MLRKKAFWGIGLGTLLVLGVVALLAVPPGPSEASSPEGGGGDEESPAEVRQVDTVRPKRHDLTIEVQEPADVKAYYRADLEAQVAGVVKRVPKAIGDRVLKGETLIEIEAPDRVQAVIEKEAVIAQRKMEWKMAKAKAEVAQKAVDAAIAEVTYKEKLKEAAKFEMAWRKVDLNRYEKLARKDAVLKDMIDLKKKFLLTAKAELASADQAIEKAKAVRDEEIAKKKAADVDIKLKDQLVEVARQDLVLAQTLLNYAKLTAPFDGLIVRRSVDPGMFVQNATRSNTGPLLSVVRTDVYTVVMKLPDTYAPYVTKDTDAIIHLPGRSRPVVAKVTRFAPAIHEQDRTMRVEVDLYNGTREQYERFILNGLSCFVPPLVQPLPLPHAGFLTVGRAQWEENMKGALDPFPAYLDEWSNEVVKKIAGLVKNLKLTDDSQADKYVAGLVAKAKAKKKSAGGLLDTLEAQAGSDPKQAAKAVEDFLNEPGENPRDPSGAAQPLLPRMYGHMTLQLKNFQNKPLIPKRAISNIGGINYIFVAEKGKARRLRVRVEASDSQSAKVVVLTTPQPTSAGGVVEERDLTGTEEVIVRTDAKGKLITLGELDPDEAVTVVKRWDRAWPENQPEAGAR
jgi:multidrug efflux pump subunit AcrA (membrane-fusion protein)